jgi:phosphoribosylamine--glycine ligase/phosphoribosylformylglycinamidine cyclo-ligase
MKVLIIGSGGREHAISWKVLQSLQVTHLFSNASNASLNCLKKTFSQKNILPLKLSEADHEGIINFTKEKSIDLVIIGSEGPLWSGLSDKLSLQGIAVFGPSKAAAEIEASKAFSKEFMQRHNIPTAKFAIFNEYAKTLSHIESIDYPYVIKVSVLAAGKGVFLPVDLLEAKDILDKIFVKQEFGSDVTVVIEERLEGEEISLMAFTDGKTLKTFPLARDFKRLGNNNTGPNTGGMGAYAPVELPAKITLESLVETILEPTINGLHKENRLFKGVIYAGLMLTKKGVYVLEFNCRLGDPETQVLMPLLSSDLIEIMQACITGTLAQVEIQWKKESTVCVVLASENYPTASSDSKIIHGLNSLSEQNPNTLIFHAGTKISEAHEIFADGGRVLNVCGVGKNLEEAVHLAYQEVEKISFEGMQYRHDIAQEKNQQDAYASAGVDISAGNTAVKLMTNAVRSTYGKEVLAGIGAFGGMYDCTAMKDMQNPVLVASTDGIGTKVHLAAMSNRLYSLGFDIVHHSVNDILVQGAKPLFFLDYIASHKLEPEVVATVVTGMADACRAVECALLGGETAEMPGVYHENMIDVAGTIVGVVDREYALPSKNITEGDVLLGLVSSGPHTNGYSLIRKIISKLDLSKVYPNMDCSLLEALLAPHRCYLPILTEALQHHTKPIKGLVHITGGGFYENIPRVLPDNISAELVKWPTPPLFKLIQQFGHISEKQMYTIFNMGIGMVVIIDPKNIALIESLVHEPMIPIGHLVKGNKQVLFT